MIKFVAAALAGLVLVPAAASAADAPQQRFTRDGNTYVYRIVEKKGHTVIDGRRYPAGSAFRLTVRGDQVSGMSGGVPVAFSVADAQRQNDPQLAAR